jgi:3-oxoacyl-[acyl-carrier protein] reductase
MDLGLNDKVAVVTAASRGLGRAIAEELAAEGARVVVSSRNAEALEETAAAIRKSTGGSVRAITAELMDAASVNGLIGRVENEVGPIDILVASSPGPITRPFTDLTDDDWRQAIDEKLMAQIRPVRAVFPHMVGRGRGRIITIAGTHGYFPHAYAITACGFFLVAAGR